MTDALREAPWLLTAARAFQKAGGALYLVGGAVRNPLMGLPISDVDVCGPLPPEAVCALCENTAVSARLRAAHFGTVELYVTDDHGIRHMAEYTTFREDSYRCGHKPESVRFTTDMTVDALRRDFSVNALYRQIGAEGLGPVQDSVSGLHHLAQGVLHTVTPDPDQVLKDDGLRVLRAARFAAELDLIPSGALLHSLTRYAPLLGDIARERLRDELSKVLLADIRYPMLKRRRAATESGLHILSQTGAWDFATGGLPYDEEAVLAMKRLDAHGLAPLPLRMALLCRKAEPSLLADKMTRLCFATRDARTAALWLEALQALSAHSLDRVSAAKAGMEALKASEMLLAALENKDALAHVRQLMEHLCKTHAPLSLRELHINGDDLLTLCRSHGLRPQVIGQTLNLLWEQTLRGETPNEKAALTAAAVIIISTPGSALSN